MRPLRIRHLLAGALITLAAQAQGAGFGVYLSKSAGDAEFDGDFTDYSANTNQSAFGIMFDNNIFRDRLFNYRLSIEKGALKYSNNGEMKMDELAMTHDFGFGFVRQDNLRIWAGPELRLSVQEGNSVDSNWTGAGAGLGVAAGVNWWIGNGVALTAKAGYVVSDYVIDRNGYYYTSYAYYYYNPDNSFDVTHRNRFLNLGIVITND